MIHKKPAIRSITGFLDRSNIWFNKFNIKKIIFKQTTTIGIRYRKEQRIVLPRHIKEIETPLGKLLIKEVIIDGEKRCYPEYESAKKLALENHCSLQEVYQFVK